MPLLPPWIPVWLIFWLRTIIELLQNAGIPQVAVAAIVFNIGMAVGAAWFAATQAAIRKAQENENNEDK